MCFTCQGFAMSLRLCHDHASAPPSWGLGWATGLARQGPSAGCLMLPPHHHPAPAPGVVLGFSFPCPNAPTRSLAPAPTGLSPLHRLRRPPPGSVLSASRCRGHGALRACPRLSLSQQATAESAPHSRSGTLTRSRGTHESSGLSRKAGRSRPSVPAHSSPPAPHLGPSAGCGLPSLGLSSFPPFLCSHRTADSATSVPTVSLSSMSGAAPVAGGGQSSRVCH